MDEKFNAVQFLKAIRNGERVICPVCKEESVFVPVGECQNPHVYHCGKCSTAVNID